MYLIWRNTFKVKKLLAHKSFIIILKHGILRGLTNLYSIRVLKHGLMGQFVLFCFMISKKYLSQGDKYLLAFDEKESIDIIIRNYAEMLLMI